MSNIINYFGNAGLKHNKNKTEVVNHNLRNTPLQVLVDPEGQLFQDSVREARMLGIQIDTVIWEAHWRTSLWRKIKTEDFQVDNEHCRPADP